MERLNDNDNDNGNEGQLKHGVWYKLFGRGAVTAMQMNIRLSTAGAAIYVCLSPFQPSPRAQPASSRCCFPVLLLRKLYLSGYLSAP